MHPWTAKRSNQSILKEISPGCSLVGLMLKLKLQYFDHLMRRADSFETSSSSCGEDSWHLIMLLGLRVLWSQAEMLQRGSSWAKPSLIWERGAFLKRKQLNYE